MGMDGNVKLETSPRVLMERFLASGADVGLYTIGRSLDEEVRWVVRAGFAKRKEVTEQANGYRRQKFEGNKTYYGKIVLRRMNLQHVEAFETTWFHEYLHGAVRRDQVSLPYALWRHGIRVYHLGLASKEKKGKGAVYSPAFTTWFSRQDHAKGFRSDSLVSVGGHFLCVVHVVSLALVS